MFMFNFSVKLKELRLNNDLTQKQLAKNICVGERSIQDYEYGNRKPNYDAIIKLADYFDVSTDYLLGRTDNPNSHKL